MMFFSQKIDYLYHIPKSLGNIGRNPIKFFALKMKYIFNEITLDFVNVKKYIPPPKKKLLDVIWRRNITK